jgi:hypothetical protein
VPGPLQRKLHHPMMMRRDDSTVRRLLLRFVIFAMALGLGSKSHAAENFSGKARRGLWASKNPLPSWRQWPRRQPQSISSGCAYLSLRIEGGKECRVALGQKEIVRSPISKYCLSAGQWRIAIRCSRGNLVRTIHLAPGEHLKWIVKDAELKAR